MGGGGDLARPCTVCAHPQRESIDRLLLGGNVGVATIASEFGVNERAVYRHRASHLPAVIGLAAAAPTVAQGNALLAQLEDLRADAQELQRKAEEAQDIRTALVAIREQGRLIETLLAVAGELQTQPTVNVVFAQEWIQVRAVLLQALAPYPDARQAVAQALKGLEP